MEPDRKSHKKRLKRLRDSIQDDYDIGVIHDAAVVRALRALINILLEEDE